MSISPSSHSISNPDPHLECPSLALTTPFFSTFAFRLSGI